MTDFTPEDGEHTSFAERTKDLYRKHRGKILAVGGAVGSVALTAVVVIARNSMQPSVPEDTEDQEQTSATETTGEPRQSPTPHLRKLAEGQNASEEKQAQYKAETGDDLAPGTTWVHPPEDEDPGEAAA
ncbi:hypothetical protein RM550_27315 [Streptomyces sp. DSM 41527]|uniref:M23 family peptidase n=1 Tax=Streptomyces mooreae TaxID=3075523 RepID=A0ABU2TEL1_9ACTN|nr:hypothetical protein [Streptomyces sp. DSM 41527]MDT0459381.1 hypothetical protein [Streptomyces sp. DSM 41527]